MKKYLPYIRENWYCFLLSPLFMTLERPGNSFCRLSTRTSSTGALPTETFPYILRNGGFMLVIAMGMLACGVLGAFFAIRGSARMAAGVRKDTFARIQTFSFSISTGFPPVL